jgi:hypothetical protein
MNFQTVFVSTLVAVSAATNYESHVEVFDGDDCKGHMLDRTLKTGACHSMKKDVVVKELSDKGYGHVKQSGDNPNEIYLFHSKADCEAYGDDFNPAVEVVFIRAPGQDNCYSIVRGGTAKSIRFTAPKAQGGGSDVNVENKSADAHTIVASSLALIVATTASMFF